MRIVFVSREFPPSRRLGGIAYYLADFSREAVLRGHEVHVVCAADDRMDAAPLSQEGVVVHRVGGGDFVVGARAGALSSMRNKYRELFSYRSYRKRLSAYLERLCSELTPDWVEFADFGAEGLYWLKKMRETRVAIRLHGPTSLDRATGGSRFRSSRDFLSSRGEDELLLLSQADLITAPSQAMMAWAKRYAGENIRIQYVPNSIDVRYWAEGVEEATLNDRPVVFFAGTVVESKGCANLVKACQFLRDSGSALRLVLAGRHGSFARQLVEGSLTGGALPEWISLLGQVDRESLRALYRSADVCVFPSWWEPFGLVCAEAMASGGIVVGSSAGGMADIIEHGLTGWLVNPHRVLDLAGAIQTALSLPEGQKAALRASARSAMLARFDHGLVVAQMLQLYEETSKRKK